MRTTLDLDDELLALATARFPPGTSKTVILEEALRAYLRVPADGRQRPAGLMRLISEGVVKPASARGEVPEGTATVSLEQLLRDLETDRADR